MGQGVTGGGQLRLDAKFSVPQPRPGSVSRAGLIKTAQSGGHRVVAITAPAGYGKSALLAEWAQVEGRRVAWVSLDRCDDDPAALLASLAAAYCRAGLGSADLIADVAGRGVSWRCAVPRLAAEIRASAVPFVFMLDDLHEVQSHACHDVLGVVISAIPPGSQLAAASRDEQPHLPRFRVSGDALELGAGDLALDADGAQQIFEHEHVSLTPELAAEVTERAEGWPAGLYLAALAAKQNHGQVRAVTGDDRYVADYLSHEAFIRQPKTIQRFLRRTAVLEQLCGPLCEAVLGSSAAAVQLRRLEAHSLFLTSLDSQRQWYRYHTLYREFLLGELRRTEPGIIMTLHRRAADWYESNGYPEMALEQLLLMDDDPDRAVRLTAKLARPTYVAGQLSTVQRWYRTIGDVNIARYPPLAVLRCWEGVLTGDTAKAETWAAVVDAVSFEGEPATGAASFDSARALLRAGLCASGPEQMMADAAFSLAQEPAWSPWRDTGLWLLAESHLLAGRPGEAREAFGAASTAAAGMSSWDTIPLCEAQVAWLAMDHGEWDEAAGRLDTALGTIDAQRLHGYVSSLTTFAGAARLSLHQGDVKEARRQLTRAMRARPAATYLLPYHAARLRLQLARVYLALAEQATVHQLLREIDEIASRRPALGTLIDEVQDFRDGLASRAAPNGIVPLTPAELRVLPYLPTHLTADKIAERLFLSGHTVKTEIKAVYRKLGVSSRNDAVQRATEIGLLGG